MPPTGLKHEKAKRYTDEPPMAAAYCKGTPGCVGYMIRISKRPILREGTKEALKDVGSLKVGNVIKAYR